VDLSITRYTEWWVDRRKFYPPNGTSAIIKNVSNPVSDCPFAPSPLMCLPILGDHNGHSLTKRLFLQQQVSTNRRLRSSLVPSQEARTSKARCEIDCKSAFRLTAVLIWFSIFAYSTETFVLNVLQDFPLTFDLSKWFARRSTTAIGIAPRIAVYGFRCALGKKSPDPNRVAGRSRLKRQG
jgi:hypothetical protein